MDPTNVRRAAQGMPGQPILDSLSETFKVLGNPNRLRIVHALSVAELCVSDLATLLGSTDSAVSHQLRVMRSMRLVKCRKAGRHAYYSLDDPQVHRLFTAGLEHQKNSAGHTAPRRPSPVTWS